MSGGQKQRVAIASVLCKNSKLLFFDEPTSGMDGDGLCAIIRWVKLLAEKGKIVIIITHDLLLSEATSNKSIYLEEGKQLKDREDTGYEYN